MTQSYYNPPAFSTWDDFDLQLPTDKDVADVLESFGVKPAGFDLFKDADNPFDE